MQSRRATRSYHRDCQTQNSLCVCALVKFTPAPSRDREGAGFSIEIRGHSLITRTSQFKVDQYLRLCVQCKWK